MPKECCRVGRMRVESWKSLIGGCIEPEKVYFVCTGNICRSAFAEEFSRQCMTGATREFASAGVGAVVGSGMDRTMFEAAHEVGLIGSDHVARQLTGRMLREAAVVIVFDQCHLEWITREFPEYLPRTFMIGHLVRVLRELPKGARVEPDQLGAVMRTMPLDPEADRVSDPYMRGPEAARAAVDEIVDALTVIGPVLF